ncbi:MAG: S1 family peptidase [Bdellovibrionia bacterium]
MLKTQYTVFVPLLMMWLCFSCAPQKQDGSELIEQTSLVTNGISPKSEALISHTAVRVNSQLLNGAYNLCSGAVIAPNVVLTAAHCVTSQNSNGQIVVLPGKNVTVENAFGSFFQQRVSVERILVHEKYLSQNSCIDQKRCSVERMYSDYGRDIALLKLTSNLPREYRPAVIERDVNQVYQQDLQFAGFGAWILRTSEEDTNQWTEMAVGRILRKQNIQIGDADPSMGSSSDLSHRMTFEGEGSDAALCHGDSGGPIFYERNGRISIVGVSVGYPFTTERNQKEYRCARSGLKQLVATVFATNFTFLSEGVRELAGLSLPQ